MINLVQTSGSWPASIIAHFRVKISSKCAHQVRKIRSRKLVEKRAGARVQNWITCDLALRDLLKNLGNLVGKVQLMVWTKADQCLGPGWHQNEMSGERLLILWWSPGTLTINWAQWHQGSHVAWVNTLLRTPRDVFPSFLLHFWY